MGYFLQCILKKKTTLWPLFMDGVQLPQGYNHFEEAVYFLPFSSQKVLVLILSTSEGWEAESTLEPPSGFEHGFPGLGIQRRNHYAIAPLFLGQFYILDRIVKFWRLSSLRVQMKKVSMGRNYTQVCRYWSSRNLVSRF